MTYPATGNLPLSIQLLSSTSGEVRHLSLLAPRYCLPLYCVAAERNDGCQVTFTAGNKTYVSDCTLKTKDLTWIQISIMNPGQTVVLSADISSNENQTAVVLRPNFHHFSFTKRVRSEEMWRVLPAWRQRQPQEGLVCPKFSVELHEVFLFPLHHPRELPVFQLYLKHCRHRLDTQQRCLS